MRLETYHEGPSAQILYIGPYAEEDETIRRIHRFITGSLEQGALGSPGGLRPS